MITQENNPTSKLLQSIHGNKSLLALVINDVHNSQTANYLINRLSVHVSRGGPEFLVTISSHSEQEDRTFLLLDCSNQRLLREAENCLLRKATVKGDVVPFTQQPASKLKFGDLDRILSSSEKIRLAVQILSRVVVNSADHRENPDLKIGSSLISQLSEIGIVGDVFPLHDVEELQTLSNSWYNARFDTFEPSYDKIRDYFGEKIAIYFAFLGYYTRALFLPSCLALYNCLLRFNDDNVHAQAPFAAFNIIYLSIFLKFWKRRCSAFAYDWGTYGCSKFEMIRPGFRGEVRPSPVTGQKELWYPDSSRYRIMICETYPIICLCLVAALLIMWGYFVVQLWAEKTFPLWTFRDVFMVNMPNIVYSIIIYFSNTAYKKLATKLTHRENHRLPSEYDYHLLMKLILFQFINCFCYLFYVAFILRDMERLRRYLACNLVTWQIIQQILECAWPFVRIYFSQKISIYKVDKKVRGFVENDVVLESKLDLFEDTFDDFLEMWLQFGYAFMFSSVFPMASLYGFVNNLLEMRSDAFKLCVTMRRPFPEMADSMGIWQPAFEAIIVVAVMTNCALLGMTATKADAFKVWQLWHIVILFILVEHAMLFVYFVVNKLIPDVSEKVRLRIARSEYLMTENQNCCNMMDMNAFSRFTTKRITPTREQAPKSIALSKNVVV